MKKLIVVLLSISVMACSGDNDSKPQSKPQGDQTPVKNVIFLIGDGMGLAQVSKAMQSRDKPLNLEKATHVGLIKTTSSKEQITDSAAGATAFSIGIKTFNGAVGLDGNGQSKTTILEMLAADGYSTGLIATSGITHATPASFFAHVKSRDNYYSIAEAMVDAPVSLFIGGAEDHFDKRNNKKRGKPDDRDLVKEMEAKGVTFIRDLSGLEKATGRVAYFTSGKHPDSIIKGRSDYLPESIKPSIEFLQKESEVGFFMVVEGSQIDWGGHANDLDYTISELYDFDNAVGEAIKFAKKDGNTLVLITADHETGGLTLPTSDIESEDPYSEAGHAFSSMGHTSTMVPVYAYGKGAEDFTGVYENTAIYHKLLSVLGK
ncbi:MAG: alkaline phosphatase [Arenicella sp.]|jgi:alkaline phosphatase